MVVLLKQYSRVSAHRFCKWLMDWRKATIRHLRRGSTERNRASSRALAEIGSQRDESRKNRRATAEAAARRHRRVSPGTCLAAPQRSAGRASLEIGAVNRASQMLRKVGKRGATGSGRCRCHGPSSTTRPPVADRTIAAGRLACVRAAQQTRVPTETFAAAATAPGSRRGATPRAHIRVVQIRLDHARIAFAAVSAPA
jgi:hypothetical protein